MIGRPPSKKINDIKLIQMLNENKSRKECAEFFGVSVPSIDKAHNRIKKKIKAAPPIDGNKDVTTENIDSIRQLKKINETIVEQLKRCNSLILREEVKSDALDVLQKRLADNPNDIDAQETLDKIWGNNVKQILSIQTNLISASGEIRKQIELQLKIAEALHNIQTIQEFQSEIISILREVDPFTAQKFIVKLKERRTIRGLIGMTP